MSIEKMREEIAKVYSDEWVKNRPDGQIAAIYYSLVNRGLIKKPVANQPYYKRLEY